MSLADSTKLAVKHCEKLGMDEAEAFAQSQRIVEVVLERAEIQSERIKTQRGIGIRVTKNKKLGFAFASTLSKPTIEEACRNAASLANASIPNPDWISLPLSRKFPKTPNRIFDSKTANMSGEDVLNLAIQAYDKAKAYDKRVEIDDGKFSVATNEIAIANSHGIDAAEKSTILYGYLICVAKEHGTASSMAFEYDVATSLADLSPELIGKQAAEKAIASLKPKAAKSFTGKVILDSDPAAEVIVSSIISSINADNVQRGRSLWAEKIGEKVASQKLTVSDDGLLPKGVGSSSFDSEGTPHQKTPIITRGKLEGFLYNSFTANKEKRKSTGSAYRESYSQLPSIGVSNLMIGAGKKKLEKIISEVDKGIVVRRFSGNIMHESGEFSGIAKQASYIEKGEIKYPLKETMISGNVFEAINHIIEVGSEIRPTLYRVYVPPILFDNINIVSK